MTLFELVFILLLLGSIVGLILAAVLRGRRGARLMLALASVWAFYLLLLLFTDVFSSQTVFKVCEDQCFDEMCFAVVDVQMVPAQAALQSGASANRVLAVTIGITSHSLGRAQAEGGLRGRLYDNGTYINVSAPAQKAFNDRQGASSPLTQKIAPGESTLSVLVFEVPQAMTHPALTLDHGFTPGYLVIGESPFFHKPDIHKLRDDW